MYRSVRSFIVDASHNRLLMVPALLYAVNNYLKFTMQVRVAVLVGASWRGWGGTTQQQVPPQGKEGGTSQPVWAWLEACRGSHGRGMCHRGA